MAGWRGEVNVPGLTQVRPDLLVQVSGDAGGRDPLHRVRAPGGSTLPGGAQAGSLPPDGGGGQALPLLMVCETARGRQNFRAAAGTLPMLTTTLELALALAGPVTGAVTVWSRDGVPAALHCR